MALLICAFSFMAFSMCLESRAQNGIEQSADFAGMDHVDIQIIEYFRMAPESIGECGATLDLHFDFANRLSQARHFQIASTEFRDIE